MAKRQLFARSLFPAHSSSFSAIFIRSFRQSRRVHVSQVAPRSRSGPFCNLGIFRVVRSLPWLTRFKRTHFRGLGTPWGRQVLLMKAASRYVSWPAFYTDRFLRLRWAGAGGPNLGSRFVVGRVPWPYTLRRTNSHYTTHDTHNTHKATHNTDNTQPTQHRQHRQHTHTHT